MLSTKLAGQILFHITHICLPIWGKGNFCKHSAYQSSHSHTAPIKNERTTKRVSKRILHFIIIITEWRYSQHLNTHTGAILLYSPVVVNHRPTKPINPWSFQLVDQWFSWSMNQSSHTSRLRVRLDGRKWEWADSPAVLSHRQWTEPQLLCGFIWKADITWSHYCRRIMTEWAEVDLGFVQIRSFGLAVHTVILQVILDVYYSICLCIFILEVSLL